MTAWAANLAEKYAPDLNIIGAAYGGTPIDTRNFITMLNGGIAAALAGATWVGLMTAYPEMNNFVLSHMTPDGKQKITKYRSPNFCIQDGAKSDPFTDFLKLTNIEDPLDTPIIKAVLARETLLSNVSSVGVSVPKFPRYIWHAGKDELCSFPDEAAYVSQQCQQGANIQFQVYNQGRHIIAATEGLPAAFKFMAQVFKGTTPKVQCGTTMTTDTTASSASGLFGLRKRTAAIGSLERKSSHSRQYSKKRREII